MHRAHERRVTLPDGDILAVQDDCPSGWETGGRVAILGHGLGGCHRSPTVARLAAKLFDRGVRVFRYDMRGCGAGSGLALRPYHAGRSDDLAEVVRAVMQWCMSGATTHSISADVSPPSITLVGISLSGNMLLKYLGEAAERVPSAVIRAIAVNPPIDLARSVASLRGPINRWYDRYFVSALRRHVAEHQQHWPDAPAPIILPFRPQRLEEFDDQYTAPLSGYTTGAEYYRLCSAGQFIPNIQVPTVVLTSCDDPLVPVECFEEQSAWPEHVRLGIIPGGGHLGYFARSGMDPDAFWLDWRLVELITAA